MQNTYYIKLLENNLANFRLKGNKYIACCPYHTEKTPSFTIDTKCHTFHCFGCGESGDLIELVNDLCGNQIHH